MMQSVLYKKSQVVVLFTIILFQCVLLVSSLEQVTSEEFTATTQSAELNQTDEDTQSMVEAYPSWVLLCSQIMPTVLFIDRYFTLISYILGFPGNIISLLVWTSRCMYRGNSAAIYLAALSINDLIVLIMALIRDLNRVWDVREYFFPGYCEIKMTTTPAVQYSSPLFVLGFTVERWLAICRPFAIDRICSARRAIYICILIITITTIICSGNAYIFLTTEHYCEKRDPHSVVANIYLYVLEGIFSGIVPFLVLIFNCLVIRELARIHHANKELAILSNRLFNVDQQSQTKEASCFGKYCLPCATNPDDGFLASCCKFYRNENKVQHPVYQFNFPSETNEIQATGMLDNEIKDSSRNLMSARSSHLKSRDSCKSRQRSSALSDETRSSYKSRHNPSFRSTTVMLLVVSFYMIITTMLGGLVYALHQGSEVPDLNLTKKQALQDPVWATYMKIMLIKTIGDEIALSHYAMGFIIYYATGRNFRQRVHQLLRKLCLRLGCHCRFVTKLGVSEDYDLSSTRRRTQKRVMMNDEQFIDLNRTSEYPNSIVKETDYPKLGETDSKQENGMSHQTTRENKTHLLRSSMNKQININDNNPDQNGRNSRILNDGYSNSVLNVPHSKISIDSTRPLFSAHDLSIQMIDA